MPNGELSSSSSSSPPGLGGLCNGVLLPGLGLPFSQSIPSPCIPGPWRAGAPLGIGCSVAGEDSLLFLSPGSALQEPCLHVSPSWPLSPGRLRVSDRHRLQCRMSCFSPDLQQRLCLARGQACWPLARESLCAPYFKACRKPHWNHGDYLHGLKLNRCSPVLCWAAGSRLIDAQDPAPRAPWG